MFANSGAFTLKFATVTPIQSKKLFPWGNGTITTNATSETNGAEKN